MNRLLTGTMLMASFALALPALAAPGQCSLTGFETFDCDVQLDGGGLAFALPDGQIFAFALTEEGVGQAYLIAAGEAPGRRPQELGRFSPSDDRPGCWMDELGETEFCAMVFQ